MNGVDYSKQLAKEREYFQDTIKKTKDASEKRVEDSNTRNEHVQTKQRENFIQDRAELEKGHQKSLDKLKANTTSLLESGSDKSSKAIEKERQEFTDNALIQSKEYNDRLNDIKSSYKRSVDSERHGHRETEDFKKQRYEKTLADNLKTHTDYLEDHENRQAQSNSRIKNDFNREKSELVRAQENQLANSQMDGSKQRAALKSQINTELKRAQEIHEADLNGLHNHGKEKQKAMQHKFDEKNRIMANDYAYRSDNLADKVKQENLKSQKEHQDQLLDQGRAATQEVNDIKLEQQRRDFGSGEMAEVMHKQQGLNDKILLERRTKELQNQIVDAQVQYQERAGVEQKAFNQTFRDENKEKTTLMERKLSEANAEKLSTVAHEREKALKKTETLDNINKTEKTVFEQQLKLERDQAKERITKLRTDFNDSMKKMDDMHKERLDSVTKTSNDDKSEFIKKMNETRTKEVFEMKREFSKMLDSTVGDYEQRLSNYERENAYLKMSMDQKVQNILDQTEKKLEINRKLFEDRRMADIQGQQLLMDQRESQLKKDNLDMKATFQKKMDKIQIESETKLKLLTNDYENRLNDLRSSTTRHVGQKEMENSIERERIKQVFEEEKSRLVSTYENQLQSMKQGHKTQMENMKEYKRING